jgi:N-acetylneuraminic acid mutarotase
MELHWTLSNPMPEPRSDYAAGVIGDKLIVAGGTFWTGTKDHWIQKQFSASTHEFDPVSQAWKQLPPMPFPLACAASAVVDGKLFVTGGFTGTQLNRKILVLEKTKDHYAWKEFGTFPFDRVYPRSVAIGKLLYVIGGTLKFEPRDPTGTCCTSKTATRTLLVLDTQHPADGWKELASYPGDLRFYFMADTDGKNVWMFGGIYQELPADPVKQFSDVCRYEPATKKWEQAKPLPELSHEGNNPSPVFVDNGFVLISDFQKVWKFDVTSQEYRELPKLPEAASVDRFVRIGNQIIGASGENFIQGPRRRSEWVFAGKLGGK